MPTIIRTIRLFVSSTFSDFKAERDVLQRDVFPKLRQLCLSKGLRFQAIDLRWGVSEEAGKDNRTMRICLRELRRCQEGSIRPNFLVLLGDRYGWQPLPEVIRADVFEELERELATKSAKNAEILNTWYRRDDNAAPAEYVLQRRTGRFEEFAVWEAEVERPLLAALVDTVQSTSSLRDSAAARATLPIGLSATHQEILHGALALESADARSHVHAFARTVAGAPTPPHRDFVDLLSDGSPDTRSRDALAALCSRLKTHLGTDANFHGYSVPWRDDGRFSDTDLASFAAIVFDALRQVIETQIATLADIPPEEQEENAHRAFAEERRAGFIGREEALRQIARYLGIRSTAGAMNPLPEQRSDPVGLAVLAVVGPAGSGKSALMAQAISEGATGNHQSEIIARFIGATPGSSDLIQLLRDLVGRIRSCYPRQPESAVAGHPAAEPGKKPPDDHEIPTDLDPLTTAFHEALARATAERPLWIFLDALDQLSDSNIAHSLAWLPQELPDHVRIVVSAAHPSTAVATSPLPTAESPQSRGLVRPENRSPTTDHRLLLHRHLARLAPGEQTIRLDPLTPADGDALLGQWLAAAGRKLQEPQSRAILVAFAVEGNALWLRVAADEAGRWPSWHNPAPLPSALPDLLATLLVRLSCDQEHGEVMVKRALGYLASARHGLAEDEIIGILGADPVVMADVVRRSPTEHRKSENDHILSLPVAIWVRFHGDIACYLTERENQGAVLICFYHRSFGEAVTRFCMPNNQNRLSLHENMTRWFGAKQWFIPPTSADGTPDRPTDRSAQPNTRKASELPWHYLRMAELSGPQDRWDLLVDVLCDLDCVEAKARSGLIYELLGDYTSAIEGLPELGLDTEASMRDNSAQPIRRGIEGGAARQRRRMIKQTVTDGSSQVTRLECARADRLQHFANFASTYATQMYHHPRDTSIMAFNYAEAGPVHAAAAKATLAVKTPWLMRAPRPARSLRPECLRVFEVDVYGITEVWMTPNGRHIHAAGAGTHQIWDLRTGACLRGRAPDKQGTLNDFRGFIPGRSNTGMNHAFERIGACHIGLQLQSLHGAHTDIHCACLSSSGDRLFTADSAGAIQVWDTTRATCEHTLGTHKVEINSLGLSPDGDRLVSAYADGTVRIWDWKTGICIHTLQGHSSRVTDARVCPDGNQLVSASTDGSLRIWSMTTGNCLRIIENEDYAFTCLALSPDGRLLISGSDVGHGHRALNWHRGTIHLWDFSTGQMLRSLDGHTDAVRSLFIGMDSSLIVSASDDKTVRVWNAESDDEQHPQRHHRGRVNDVSIRPDGRFAISASEDETLRLWDAQNGACLRIFEGNAGIQQITFQSDGRQAIAADDALVVKQWEIPSGRTWTLWRVGRTPKKNMCSLLDGRHYVAPDDKGTIWVHDLKSGTSPHHLNAHRIGITSLACTVDGNIAISTGYDGVLRVWDVRAGQWDCVYHATSAITGVAVSPSGERIVCGSTDGQMHFLTLINGPSKGPAIVTMPEIVASRSRMANALLNPRLSCPRCGALLRAESRVVETLFWYHARYENSKSQSDRGLNVSGARGIQLSDGSCLLLGIDLPCRYLPDDAYHDPNLSSICRGCGEAIRFNPFFTLYDVDDQSEAAKQMTKKTFVSIAVALVPLSLVLLGLRLTYGCRWVFVSGSLILAIASFDLIRMGGAIPGRIGKILMAIAPLMIIIYGIRLSATGSVGLIAGVLLILLMTPYVVFFLFSAFDYLTLTKCMDCGTRMIAWRWDAAVCRSCRSICKLTKYTGIP